MTNKVKKTALKYRLEIEAGFGNIGGRYFRARQKMNFFESKKVHIGRKISGSLFEKKK